MVKKAFPWIRLARVFAILVLITLPLAGNTFTDAKFIASAEQAAATARVAMWKVRLTSADVTVEPMELPGVPAEGLDARDHPAVLFFRGIDGTGAVYDEPSEFIAVFHNESQVRARFTPTVAVDTPAADPFLAAVKSAIKFYDDEDNDITLTGVELAPNTSMDITVVIGSCTFTNLRIGARAEQVD